MQEMTMQEMLDKARKTDEIENILTDYGLLKEETLRFVLDQYQKVIVEITRGRLSKLTYPAEIIINMEEDVSREYWEKEFAPKAGDDWISVKDKLPDEGTEVLIYCPEFLEEIRKAFYTEGDFYVEKEDLIVKPAPNGYCTHWQHLPEPPKGE